MSILKMIPLIGGNLEASGKNGSETKHIKWHIGFNQIELLLIQTLNDAQIKLYKMLKIRVVTAFGNMEAYFADVIYLFLKVHH